MTDQIIKIENVRYRYKGSESESLADVSLSVKAGETLLLCGASGSGKTSVIRMINGLIPHYYNGELAGNVTVAGRNIAETELCDLAGTVGTVFQNPRSQFFSVDTDGEIVFGPENVGLPPSEIRKRKVQVVAEMGIEKLLDRSLFELSGGEKQRIACASVAALLPEIILLDEPSSNLDWAAMENLREIILTWKKQGKTVIVSEHRLWYLTGIIDRAVFMKKGRIEGEWSGKDFAKIPERELQEMALRPTTADREYADLFRDDGVEGTNGGEPGTAAVNPDAEETADGTAVTEDKKPVSKKTEAAKNDGIVLRDFYFSYKKKPYIFRRHKFTKEDGEDLSLCVPELSLPKGKVIAVVGRNGTGKSTFLRCLCGLEKDCTGEIEADGTVYKGRKRIGFSYMVMQDVNHQLFTDSVKSEVLLSMKVKDEKQCLEILRRLGLLGYKDTHPMALSGGQKQRVAIASAIAAGAELLLFDEPTSGLDYAHMVKVGKMLRELADGGSTVLVSTHDPELIRLCCDTELVIRRGRASFRNILHG